MENRKTYKEKLQFIISKVPWIYDTYSTAIVNIDNNLNHLQLLKEIDKFEKLCKEQFSDVEIQGLCYEENKGMVLHFNINYNSRLFAQECLTSIINGIRNGTIIRKTIKETIMTDVDIMEKTLTLSIEAEYKSELKYLIDLLIFDNTIYNDILSTLNSPKTQNKVIDILEEGYVSINNHFREVERIVKDIWENRGIKLNPSDYVILNGSGDFVRFTNGDIVIYGSYEEAYNDLDPLSDDAIVSVMNLSERKIEELIKYIRNVTK